MQDFATSRCQCRYPGGALAGWPVLFIAAAAFVVVIPFFFLGIPSGHDFDFHLNSWMEVVSQWRQGIIYPRWAALAYYGYGEARFVFYPPASWFLGAALGSVLPWRVVPGVYVWLALVFAGCSMFVLTRRWLNRNEAIFAAALYAANPYYIVIIYWRSAYAELLAGALLPLVLLCVIRIDENDRKAIVPLALVVAAATLTNLPASVMVNYSVVLLALTLSILRRSPRALLYAAAAGLLGAAVAAFYILPAAYEEKWINIAQVLSPGVRPQDNFLFTTISDPDHNRFNRLVSLVAAAELIVLAITASFSRRQHQKQLRLRWVILIWAGGSALLMFSFSVAFWLHLPLLRFIQLPWRWLLCLNVTLVVLTALAWKQWLWRATAILLMLAVLAFVWRRVQPPWWDSVSDIADIVTQHQSGAGYEGTDEYVPAGADPYDVKPDAPFVALNTGGPLQVQVQRWSPETKLFIVEAQQPGKLVLRLFNYPAWQVLVNGHRVEAETQDDTGKMLIPIVAGESAVYVGFVRTWDRRLGGIVSLVSVAGLLLWFARGRFRSEVKRVLIATSNPGKLRDFAGAAAAFGIEVNAIPNFASLPPVLEDGATFEANARKKAEAYSRYVPGEMVLADDSGLEVDALGGAPGVRSARYAAEEPHLANSNTHDAANNARLLRELKNVPSERRGARFVCVIAAARDGHILGVFRGQAEGTILDAPRGQKGFGYDPLFYFASIQKTFAELSAEEKAQYSHRGAAFREFLRWYGSGVKNP